MRAARPVLQTLVSRVGEVALLSVQQGNRSLTVLREESHQSLRAGGWVGRSSPMHCTASGRALLFDSADELVEALTAEGLLTPISTLAAPMNLDELLEKLKSERAQGYSVASEEVEIGLTSVSTPVRDRNNTITSVINISGPTSRLITHIEDIAKLLKGGSATIQRTLTSPGRRRAVASARIGTCRVQARPVRSATVRLVVLLLPIVLQPPALRKFLGQSEGGGLQGLEDPEPRTDWDIGLEPDRTEHIINGWEASARTWSRHDGRYRGGRSTTPLACAWRYCPHHDCALRYFAAPCVGPDRRRRAAHRGAHRRVA
ncbi:IclR family transcriptional regulator [Rhodococcus opacus]|uniref:IclR family transcriptional regulator n=1 Tax=Rhodococcus opacus TaxID=37919 RepID=UPI0037C50CC1